MIATAKRHKRMAVVVVAGAFVLGGAASYAINKNSNAVNEANAKAEVIRESQVQVCESSIRPGGVRFIIAQQIREQITQSKHLDYHMFFPKIPPRQLHELIQDQRQHQYAEIHDLLDVNCAALYPKP